MTKCKVFSQQTIQSISFIPSNTLKSTICGHVISFFTKKSTICGHVLPFFTKKSTICGHVLPFSSKKNIICDHVIAFSTLKSKICDHSEPLIAIRRVCLPYIHRHTPSNKPLLIFLSYLNGEVCSFFHTFVYPYLTIHLNNEHRKRITVGRYTGNCSII